MHQQPWPLTARVAVTVSTLVALALAAIMVLGPVGKDDPEPQPERVLGTAREEAAIPLGMAPTNLDESAYEASTSIRDLGVGQTRFTTFGFGEMPSQFYMVPLARGEHDGLCLTEGARFWNTPAMQVGRATLVNVAVTRTGATSYEVVASPDDADMIQRDTLSNPYQFPCAEGTVILRDDASARKILGLVQDMEPGSQGWVPASRVNVATPEAQEGFVLADVTSPVSFPGATHLYMRQDGVLLVDGSQANFDVVGEEMIQSMRDAPDLYQAVTIGPK